MGDRVDFRNNGQQHVLTRDDVIKAVRSVSPEPVHTHAVVIEGRVFPVKQVFEVATGIDRLDFISMTARRILQKLDFVIERTQGRSVS